MLGGVRRRWRSSSASPAAAVARTSLILRTQIRKRSRGCSGGGPKRTPPPRRRFVWKNIGVPTRACRNRMRRVTLVSSAAPIFYIYKIFLLFIFLVPTPRLSFSLEGRYQLWYLFLARARRVFFSIWYNVF